LLKSLLKRLNQAITDIRADKFCFACFAFLP